MDYLKKLIIVHHDIDDKEIILGEAVVPYLKTAARKLMSVDDSKNIMLFYEEEFFEQYGRVPSDKKTELIKKLLWRIEKNPIRKLNGKEKRLAEKTDEVINIRQRKTKVNWQISGTKEIKDLLKKEAGIRNISFASLVESIVTQWLNKNVGTDIDDNRGINKEAIKYYNLGSISLIEKNNFGYSDIESLIECPLSRVDNIRRRIEKSKKLKKNIAELFKSVEKIESIPDEFKIYFYAGALGVDIRIFRP